MHRLVAAVLLLASASLAAPLTPEGIDSLRIYSTEPPADVEQRRARFAERSSPSQIEVLAHHLAGILTLDHPDLAEGFAQHYGNGRYAQALEAYRDYFLDKITHPDRHGIPASYVAVEDPDIWPIVRNMFGDEQLLHSTPASELMANRFIMEVAKPWDETDGLKWYQKIRVDLGEPGAINWSYVPPIWSNPTPLGPDMLEWRDDHTSDLNWCPLNVTAWARQPAYFGRHFRSPTAFRDLLSLYARTGDRAYLDKWVAYIDDYCMHQRADADASPYNLLASKVQQLAMFDGFIGQLAFTTLEQPKLAEQMPPATLARLMVRCLPEAAAATVRQTQLFEGNWRYMLIGRLVEAATLYREYRFSDILHETAQRTAENDVVRGNLPDGSDYEITPNYWGMIGDHWLPTAARLREAGIPWATPRWLEQVQEQARRRLRAMLANQRADGRWPIAGTQDWRQQPREFDKAIYHQMVPEFFAVPDNARRLNRAFGTSAVTGKPFGDGETDEPSYQSEWLPYGGWYYIRAGWEIDSHHGFMQNNSPIIGNGGQIGSWQPNNLLHIHGYGAELLFLHNDTPVLVDSGQQNKCFGLPIAGHSGFVLPKRNSPLPADARWHDSEIGTFVEGTYDGVYGPEPGLHVRDWLGGHELDLRRKVTDVSHTRQVHLLKDVGLWVVTDRMDSQSDHVYTQRWNLHVPEESSYGHVHGFAPDQVQVDYVNDRVATHHPEGPNVSLYQFGSSPLLLETRMARVPEQPIQTWTIGDRDRRYIENNNYLFAFTISRVHTHFRGTGSQALVSVVYPRRTDEDELAAISRFERDGKVIGFDARLTDGTQVAYRLALDGEESLRADDVSSTGESMLAVWRADGSVQVIALGTRQLKVGGHKVKLESGNAEVTVDGDGRLGVAHIHRPIVPVRIEPEADVFATPIEVSLHSDTPGVDIRYTVDGTEPTGSSPLYSSPFAVSATTTVRARAFRPGVIEVPTHFTGVDVSAVTSADYVPLSSRPALSVEGLQPGLRYTYYEGNWHEFALGLGMEQPLSEGEVSTPMDLPGADRSQAFAFAYDGYFEAPIGGIYTFYSPLPMYDPAERFMNLDAGYDLQVWVDGTRWYPGTRQHGFGTWSVALDQGMHAIRIRYADFRGAKPDLCFAYKENRAQWSGDQPTLDVSGPDLPRQPIPGRLLWHAAAAAPTGTSVNRVGQQ